MQAIPSGNYYGSIGLGNAATDKLLSIGEAVGADASGGMSEGWVGRLKKHIEDPLDSEKVAASVSRLTTKTPYDIFNMAHGIEDTDIDPPEFLTDNASVDSGFGFETTTSGFRAYKVFLVGIGALLGYTIVKWLG